MQLKDADMQHATHTMQQGPCDVQMRRPAAMRYAAGACGVSLASRPCPSVPSRRVASRRVRSRPVGSGPRAGRGGAGWDGIDGGLADIGDADQHDGLVLRPEGVRF